MDSKAKTFILHMGTILTIEVTRKRMKTIRMRLAPDGTVKVSAPYWVSDAQIESFIATHLAWIENARGKAAASQRAVPRDGGQIMVWGVSHQIRVERVGKRSKPAYLDGVELVVPLAEAKADAENVEKACNAFLAAEVRRALDGGVVEAMEARCGAHAQAWRVRSMTSRWGSCQVQKRTITINSQLARFPRRCLEYVVCHELCHLHEPSHNARFHALMDRFYPSWKEVRKELRG